jgi:GGDEF domain-containing protein
MPDTSKRLEKAEKLLHKGRLDEAVLECLAAWQEDQGNEAVGEMLADLYVRQANAAAALEIYGYLFDRAAERNDSPRAVVLFRKMAAQGARDPIRMLTAARFLEKQKREEAQDFYRQAGDLFLGEGDKARALEALSCVAALRPDDAHLQLRVGELAESLGQNALAARAFLRAAAAFRLPGGPGSPGGGQPEDGGLNAAGTPQLAALERAYHLVPNDAAVLEALSEALLNVGEAERVVHLLEPIEPAAFPARSRWLAKARLAQQDYARAEEALWQLPVDAETIRELTQVAESYVRQGEGPALVRLLDRLKQTMFGAGRQADFVALVENLEPKDPRAVELLEFLAALYAEINRDSLLWPALDRLFDAYAAADGFAKAAGVLERMADIDAYDAEHSRRLERLAGKIEPSRYDALAARLGQGKNIPPRPAPASAPRPEPVTRVAAPDGGAPAAGPAPAAVPANAEQQAQDASLLEDLILQAEIFLQYGLQPRAIERLERIAREFPGEEGRNEKLRLLQAAAGFVPSAPAAAGPRVEAAARRGEAGQADEPVADVARVSEIARTIYRQSTVKSVLSAVVNEVGKTWRVSRCVVGLCSPGKAPSAALEYCAPGMAQSDVKSIVRLITTLVGMTADGNPLAVEDVASSSRLAPLAPVFRAVQIQAVLALPLIDADRPVGVIVLEQCDRMRRWRANEIVVLKTLVDQTVITISHVKLRSLMRSLALQEENSGLLNRNSYLGCLVAECERAQKQCMPLAVALLGFGRGRQVERERGEPALQSYVSEAGQALIGHLRQNDIAVRYDAGAVALVLPDTAGKDAATVVEKLRRVLAGAKPAGQEVAPMSVGIAEAVLQGGIDPVDSVTELINRAEAALEAAFKEADSATQLLSPAISR